MFVAGLVLLPVVLINVVEIEQWIVSDKRIYVAAAVILFAAPFAVRKYFPPDEKIQWEEFPSDELINLGL